MDNFENKLSGVDTKMDSFQDSIEEFKVDNIKFQHSLNNVEKIVAELYNKLVDDERTNSVGVISSVNHLKEDVSKLNLAYKIGKWVIAIIATTSLGMIANNQFL